MPIDPFDPGTSVAQEFPTQEPDTLRRLWGIIAAQKREMFDLRASVLANVSDIVADLQAQVAATAAATAAVAAANVTLTSQQATLTSQQATLTATVADIATLVGQQTASDSGNNTVFNAVTTAWVDYAPVVITVPAGYSRAQVVGISSTNGPGNENWYIRTLIAGVASYEFLVLGGNGGIAYSRTLTGLSGGTITIATGVENISASGSTRGIATIASVTFLR